MTGARPPAWLQRTIAVVVLLATGIVSLPAVAYVLDGPTTENLVVARSSAPQKRCTGLALPRYRARKTLKTRSTSTNVRQNAVTASGS